MLPSICQQNMSNESRDESGFECPVCGDTFETEKDRDKHLTHSHPD